MTTARRRLGYGPRTMGHLNTLLRHCGTFAGHGINHEDQPFHGELVLQPMLDGRGLSAWFRATGIDGTVYHEEQAWIAPGADGALCLWGLSTNTPGVLEHRLARTGDGVLAFLHGDPHDDGGFRQRVTITLHHDGVGWAYAWGLPSGPLEERSGVRMIRQG